MQKLIYYVSPLGSDEWSGLEAEFTSNDNGPFASIERAKLAVREILNSKCNTKVEVQIRTGTYFLDNTLVFEPEDSGNEISPVVYKAYPGESPVFSGGEKIECWQDGTINGKACWIADLKDFPSDKLNFTQLFVNDKRRKRSRLPREGFYHFADLPEDLPPYEGFTKGPDRAIFKEGDILNWKNIEDVEIIALEYWFDAHHKIRKIDFEKNEVSFIHKSLGSLKDEKSEMARYYVENVMEAVELDGDWYLDRKSALLYYIPYKHECIESCEIIAPVLEQLVCFQSESIRLENLKFKHAEWKHPAVFAGSIQAAFEVPGAVVFDRAKDCVLYNCEISQLSQYAVQVGTGSSNNKIVACVMRDLGAGGVKIEHEWIHRVNLTSPKMLKRDKNTPRSNTIISDCTIHDASKIYFSAVAVWVGNAGGNVISNNHIFDVNYTGISVGWTWNYDETATVGNIIKANHIHHINWKRMLSDNGGIYTLGNSPGTICCDNHIHHINCYYYGGWGIYHDEGTTGQLVENNIVHHTKHAGFVTHFGRDNIVRNNIFALAESAHLGPGSRQDNHRSVVIENNIVYWERNTPGIGFNRIKKWNKHYFLLQNNIFWGQGADIVFDDGKILEEWQKQGQFLGTTVRDPLFASPESGDFSLRLDSPAIKMGFKPLDAQKAGPRFCDIIPVSYEDWPENKTEERPITITTIELTGPSSAVLKVENCGIIPVSGQLKLNAGPDGEIELDGTPEVKLDNLSVGDCISTEFSFKTNSSTRMFFIEAVGHGKGIMSSYIYKVLGEQVCLTAVKPCSNPKLIPEVVDKLTWHHMTNSMGFSLAQMRYGLAGDKLILQIRSSDNRITPNTIRPYEGSCIELFLAANEKITQLFVIPSKDKKSLSFSRRASGRTAPVDSIIGHCQPWENGYEALLIVPLDIAGISRDNDSFTFETAVTGFWNTDIKTRLALFNALTPSANTEGCGIMKFPI